MSKFKDGRVHFRKSGMKGLSYYILDSQFYQARIGRGGGRGGAGGGEGAGSKVSFSWEILEKK